MSQAYTHHERIELEEVREVSPHNKALYEAGKALLVQSVEVGREFCKFMTTTTLGAIPIYLALLKLVLPKDYSLRTYEEVLLLIPPLLFLLSSIIFVLGYFPQKSSFSLDLPAEIENERSITIKRRQRHAIVAFTLFCVGVLVGACVLIGKLATLRKAS